MKNQKGFTLMELIIVIAIIVVIMLIGTVAYSGIQERAKVRSDKATAAQIGKALTTREVDIGKESPLEYYPKLTIYDSLPEIETYIAKDIKPQSMEDGNFIATAIQTESGKKIMVGIGKEGEEIKDNSYTSSKESGWAWSEEIEIGDFLEENKDKLTEDVIIPNGTGSGNTGSGESNGNEENKVETIPLSEIPIGAYISYNPVHYENGEKIATVTVKGTDSGVLQSDNKTGIDQTFNIDPDPEAGGYNKGWKVLYKNGDQLTLISAESVGSLKLGTIGSVSNDETNAKLNGGKIGYAKAIYTLNKMCSEYAEGEYAVSGRSVGYNGSAVGNILEYTDADLNGDGTVDINDITHAKIRDLLGSTTGDDIIKEPWGDSYNSTETNLIKNTASLRHSSGSVWLASRRLSSNTDTSIFDVRNLGSSGNVNYYNLYYRGSSGYSISYANSYGVRPVIILESGLKIIKDDNDGTTAEKAYKLTR